MENGVCSSESANGSCDVWSCDDSSAADHLVVMVHGILGSSSDWKFGAEQFVRELPDKVFVHCSEKNMSRLTLDGVDVMGERLAQEVLEVIERKPTLRKISFVAHSVGGLVARYAIGRLYRPGRKNNAEEDSMNNVDSSRNNKGQEHSEDSTNNVDSLTGNNGQGKPKATIGGLEAMNFITVATPHLGSRGNKQVPFLFGLSALEKTAPLIIHWIFKRTGRHLFLTDNDNGQRPLLRRMIEDSGDCFFMYVVPTQNFCDQRTDAKLLRSALRTFNRRVVYSNWEECVDEKYPHIVYEEHCKACDAEESEIFSEQDDNNFDKLEEELLTGLSRVSWEKVDVSFHTSRQRFAAHSVIQVPLSFSLSRWNRFPSFLSFICR
ncbi:hypothetical protein Tsubulata_007623 [Turnera subulata]|uniref:DUF676 domain-containing protein n=1 Tax=Turnera subulata TaxID=218843 RepID=A0A9Q0FZ20_9ROSI|nr:hypothetical protein Tsubulata_007623 [Turnera subulata]